MSENDAAATPLALVFGDAGVSEHLRSMLAEIGARVVYDVGIDVLDTTALSDSGAKVVLINLDNVVETRLDEVCSSLDDEGYRVVFNDPASSVGLSGWEQARWARHLGAKLRDDADVDPPRPVDAVPVEVGTATEQVQTGHAAEQANACAPLDDAWMADALSVLDTGEPESRADAVTANADSASSTEPLAIDDGAAQQVAADGEYGLELAALDASPDENEPVPIDDVPEAIEPGEDLVASAAGSRSELLDFAMQDDPPVDSDALDADATHASVGDPAGADPELSELLQDMQQHTDASEPDGAQVAASNSDLELLDFDSTDFSAHAGDVEEVDLDKPPATANELVEPVQIDSSQWSLVDYSLDDISEAPLGDAQGVNAATTPGKSAADALALREFGIELVDPIEYLAPDSPQDRSDELFAAPELMPMHEAVAPEMNDGQQAAAATPGPARSRLPKLVVLGASIGGPDAVREFLSALPPRFPATFVLVQHLGSEFVDLMINQLGKASMLPVRVPAHAERAVPGEVLVVPRGRQIFIAADGEVELRELPETAAHDPSINLTMAMAAENFGADALAIVFSGMANDAVSGALEIAANGGSVWAQDPEHCVVSSMVDAVIAAGVVRFNGTPSALAQHLIDEIGTEFPT